MTRTIALLVVAGLTVWVLALLEPARRASTTSPDDDERDEAAAELAPSAAHPRVTASLTEGKGEPGTVARPPAVAATSTPANSRSATEPVAHHVRAQTQVARLRQSSAPGEVQGHSVAPPALPEGEEGEGLLSPEYRELEQDYMHEPRTADWAHAHEDRVRKLLVDAGLAQRLALVHCREQTCRLVVQGTRADEVAELLDLPGLRAATALESTTPFSLRGGQLVMYFRPPAAPAP